MNPITYVVSYAIGFAYGMNAESYSQLVSTIIIFAVISVLYNYLVKKKKIHDYAGSLERR